MLWPHVYLRFEDGRPDLELPLVEPGEVPIKSGEKFGPCLSIPVRALPFEVGVKPLMGFVYWDGSCWRICSSGLRSDSKGRSVELEGGEAIEASGIVALAVLPFNKGYPRCTLFVGLHETEPH